MSLYLVIVFSHYFVVWLSCSRIIQLQVFRSCFHTKALWASIIIYITVIIHDLITNIIMWVCKETFWRKAHNPLNKSNPLVCFYYWLWIIVVKLFYTPTLHRQRRRKWSRGVIVWDLHKSLLWALPNSKWLHLSTHVIYIQLAEIFCIICHNNGYINAKHRLQRSSLS